MVRDHCSSKVQFVQKQNKRKEKVKRKKDNKSEGEKGNKIKAEKKNQKPKDPRLLQPKAWNWSLLPIKIGRKWREEFIISCNLI